MSYYLYLILISYCASVYNLLDVNSYFIFLYIDIAFYSVNKQTETFIQLW